MAYTNSVEVAVDDSATIKLPSSAELIDIMDMQRQNAEELRDVALNLEQIICGSSGIGGETPVAPVPTGFIQEAKYKAKATDEVMSDAMSSLRTILAEFV